MRKKVSKFIVSSFAFSVLLFFSSITTLAISSVDQDITIRDSSYVVFSDGEINNITSRSELFNKASLNINYSNGAINALVELNGVPLEIETNVKLYPSEIDHFKDQAIIGIGEIVNEGYELLSFRLENDASSITLMEPNLYGGAFIIKPWTIRKIYR